MQSIKSLADLPDPFGNLLIREYEHWYLTLNTNQCHLGYAFLWCKEPSESAEHMTVPQATELFRIVALYTQATVDLWKATGNLNWGHYGNSTEYSNYYRIHLVPRYYCDKHFAGEVFTDFDRNGLPFPRDPKFPSHNALCQIRDALRSHLWKPVY